MLALLGDCGPLGPGIPPAGDVELLLEGELLLDELDDELLLEELLLDELLDEELLDEELLDDEGDDGGDGICGVVGLLALGHPVSIRQQAEIAEASIRRAGRGRARVRNLGPRRSAAVWDLPY
ncbi:MAG: hypothetical protein AB8B57_14465 [Congregibacter sp.]